MQVVGAVQPRGRREALRSFVSAARLLVGILAGVGLLAAPRADAQQPARRPGLLGVIDRCAGPASSPDCIQSCTDFDTCGGRGKSEDECKAVTVLWDRDERSGLVAIRDLKMCTALRATGLVHGLAIPVAPVKGLEDPKRPDGIWAFAWEVARKVIPDQDQIALLVNPCLEKGQTTIGSKGYPKGCEARSQDQLHVHLMRFCDDKQKNEAMKGARPLGGDAKALDRTWKVAGDLIKGGLEAKTYGTHGILVDRSSGQFRVAVHEGNIEEKFTYSSHDQASRQGCTPMKSTSP